MPTLSQPERFNTDAQGGSDHRILTMRLPNGCPNGCPNAPPTPPGGGGVGSHMEGGNRHYQNPEKRHNIEFAHVQSQCLVLFVRFVSDGSPTQV
jgi:hypothetical protein